MTNFWLNDPSILLNKDDITEIWPSSNMTSIKKLNAMTRLVFILTLIGFIVSRSFSILITSAITLFAIIILHYYQVSLEKKKNKLENDNKSKNIVNNEVNQINVHEGFINSDIYKNNRNKFDEPTVKNPVMNLMRNDILERPDKKPGGPGYVPEVRENINENTKKFIVSNFDNDPDIEKKLFKDLGDSYDFEQSMRNWYVTPNTQNPNDQEAFANYCYGDLKSSKECNPI